MALPLGNRRREVPFGPQNEETEEEDAQEAVRKARRRGRLQAALAAFCALGIFVGLRINALTHPPKPMVALDRVIVGTWDLQSVNNDPIGPDRDSVVLSQRMTLKEGKLMGETHLRGDTDAASVAMPFPDQTVSKVVASADGHEVVVTWNGTYTPLNSDHIELHIGKATYRAKVVVNPKTHTLELDNDAILTYRGPARYQPAAEGASPTNDDSLSPK